MFPPIPTWDGLHPIIIHFPIALLLIIPVIIGIGMFMPRSSRSFFIVAFILMLLGTIATFIAVSTGGAAGELAEHVKGVDSVLEEHEELAETTRTVFSALTVIFGVIVFAPLLLRKELSRKVLIPLNVAFLVFYGAGAVLLMNTAHQGGRLVHEFGVRAMVGTTAQTSPSKSPNSSRAAEEDDD